MLIAPRYQGGYSIRHIIRQAVAGFALASVCLAVGPACSAESAAGVEKTIIPDGVQVVAYDPDVDYMARMIACAKAGSTSDLILGAIYEQQRNLKIDNSEMGGQEKTAYFVSTDAEQVQLSMGLIQNPENTKPYEQYYTESDVVMLAKVAYCESRGIKSRTEIACVMWTILNRYDAGFSSSIAGVILAPNQFAYRASAPTVTDHGYDLTILARDVLEKWNREKNGETGVGRVLPKEYLWYSGDGQHNYFRTQFRGGTRWNYAWGHPYDD